MSKMTTSLQMLKESTRELPRLEIPMDEKGSGVNYMDELDRMANQARQQAAVSNSTLLIEQDVALPQLNISSTFNGMETPTQRQMAEAQKLIAKQQFAEALAILLAILEKQPAHHEAAYLAATCEHGLEQYEESLNRLYRLRTSGATAAMVTRIGRLCEKIRKVMKPKVFEEAHAACARGQVESAINRVRSLVKLDPDAAMYHYLLTIMYLTTGALDAASKSIETAVAVGQVHEKPQFLGLQAEIRERVAVGRMAPAADLFKKKQYRKAREALQQLNQEAKRAKLWKMFDAFLAQCEAGRPHDPAAEDEREAERLYEFILTDELTMIRVGLATGQAVLSEQMAKNAVDWLPQYCYAHFLYAHSIYCRLSDDVSGGNGPPLDILLTTLRTAADHAKRATRDPEIKAASRLLTILKKHVDYFEEQRREAEVVNPLIEKFVEVMEETGGEIGSLKQLNYAKSALKSVKRKIPQAREHVKSEDGEEALASLEKAIDGNIDQLNKIEKEIADSEIFQTVAKRFHDLMEGLEKSGGVKSEADLRRVVSELESIKGEIPKVRRKLTADRSREMLEELSKAVNRHLEDASKASDEMARAQAAAADAKPLNDCVQAFNTIMEGLEAKGGLSSYDEAQTIKRTMESLKSQCQRERTKVSSVEARKRFDELMSAIDGVIGQLSRL